VLDGHAAGTQELGDVTFEIEQLARLVEQLRCLARLDSQEPFQFAAFDAFAVALEVARELAPAALESDHDVTAATPDASVIAHGNAILMGLVFRNLIENAIQYTPAGTSITLSADTAAVIVADDGPGIAAHAVASLFERFRRDPNASGPSAGLGLAIAKCIMDAARRTPVARRDCGSRGAFRDGVSRTDVSDARCWARTGQIERCSGVGWRSAESSIKSDAGVCCSPTRLRGRPTCGVWAGADRLVPDARPDR
jgi:hypothetical protein